MTDKQPDKKKAIPHKRCAKKTLLLLFKKLEGKEGSAGYAWWLIRNTLRKLGAKV